jgi:hypothetical protein
MVLNRWIYQVAASKNAQWAIWILAGPSLIFKLIRLLRRFAFIRNAITWKGMIENEPGNMIDAARLV